jgi:hypothetical protein
MERLQSLHSSPNGCVGLLCKDDARVFDSFGSRAQEILVVGTEDSSHHSGAHQVVVVGIVK